MANLLISHSSFSDINKLALSIKKLYRLTFKKGSRVEQLNVMANNIDDAAKLARDSASSTFYKNAELIDCDIVGEVDMYKVY